MRLRIIAALLVIALLAAGVFLLVGAGKPAAPPQPIAFNHWQHVTKTGEEGKPDPGLECGFCHEHADKSAHATIPNANTCMLCHQAIKTESPEVQKLAAYAERNEQPPWTRVYSFEQEAAVFFTHKPHFKAGIECSSCHGDVANSHQIRREVEQNMGWCIDCHRSKGASIDCYACHR
jgi:hypothetical protein